MPTPHCVCQYILALWKGVARSNLPPISTCMHFWPRTGRLVKMLNLSL